MVEKARAMARKVDVAPAGRSSWMPGRCDGLPSPTSPLDRAAPSPRGWRHRDAGGVGLGILAALEPQPAAAAAAARVSASVAIAGAGAIASPRRAARLEVSEPGCSGRCATSVCGGAASGGAGAALRVAGFLACCDLCRRALDGRDIFMYRGERAFCSMECRYQAIVADEFQDRKKEHKRRSASAAPSEIPKKAAATAAAEMAGSPCAGGGQIFFTGIVAA